jgi:hypothetical protein
MARDFFINGETMIAVKGRSDLVNIAALTNFGLCDTPIHVRLDFKTLPIKVDAWGDQVAPEIQTMLTQAMVTMTLVHFDRPILDTLVQESQAGAPVIGQLARAGARMGNNLPRFAPSGTPNPATGVATTGNHFIGLNIASPVGGKTWRFFYAMLANSPLEFPLGTERSIVTLNWLCVPYTQDPWNAGLGAQGTVLWDHSQDT